jgi:Flp pilus assembly protein TadG
VEFALTVLIFLSLVIGVIEFSRVMFHWSTAVEATRLGARVAVVCDQNAAAVKNRMREILPLLQDSDIVITYPTAGCTAATSEPVTVRLNAFRLSTIIPVGTISMLLPPLSTSLTAESLSSTDNALCN